MKKTVIVILIICLLTGVALFVNNDGYEEHIIEMSGADISECILIREEDTHGGFHGDGSLIVEFDCAGAHSFEDSIADWKRLPLDENLQLIMYGGEKDSMMYGYCLAQEHNIPIIEKGFYFFLDRHSEAVDKYDCSGIFGRASFNFTICMYDEVSQRLYLLEFDT